MDHHCCEYLLCVLTYAYTQTYSDPSLLLEQIAKLQGLLVPVILPSPISSPSESESIHDRLVLLKEYGVGYADANCNVLGLPNTSERLNRHAKT